PAIGKNDRHQDLLVSADGRRLAVWNSVTTAEEQRESKKTGEGPFFLQVFDAQTGKPAGARIGSKRPFFRGGVAISGDGGKVPAILREDASPMKEGERYVLKLQVWDAETGKPTCSVLELRADDMGRPVHLSFSSDGRWLLAHALPGSSDHFIAVWDT